MLKQVRHGEAEEHSFKVRTVIDPWYEHISIQLNFYSYYLIILLLFIASLAQPYTTYQDPDLVPLLTPFTSRASAGGTPSPFNSEHTFAK